jgi:hypothetical protein
VTLRQQRLARRNKSLYIANIMIYPLQVNVCRLRASFLLAGLLLRLAR